MATTDDMAPSRPAATTRARNSNGGSTRRSSPRARSTEAQLEAQINRLQDDVKAIGASLAKLGGEKVNEAQRYGKQEYRALRQRGESMLEDVGDEFEAVERQVKDTIRSRPLTAVLIAAGIGFLLSALTR
jgi:ElaB/YqjD/DUF883 family membrane-anchored ribosome-binding protein